MHRPQLSSLLLGCSCSGGPRNSSMNKTRLYETPECNIVISRLPSDKITPASDAYVPFNHTLNTWAACSPVHSLAASNRVNDSRDNCNKRKAIFKPITVDSTPQTLWESCGLDFLKISSVIRQRAVLPVVGNATLPCSETQLGSGSHQLHRPAPPATLCLLTLPHLLPWLEQPSPAQPQPFLLHTGFLEARQPAWRQAAGYHTTYS